MHASTTVFFYLAAFATYELSQNAVAQPHSDVLLDSDINVSEKGFADELPLNAAPAIAPPEATIDPPLWSNYHQKQLDLQQNLSSSKANSQNVGLAVAQPELISGPPSQNPQSVKELPATTVSTVESDGLTAAETAEHSLPVEQQQMQEPASVALDAPSEPQQPHKLEPVALSTSSESQQSQELEPEVLNNFLGQIPGSESQSSDPSELSDPLDENEDQLSDSSASPDPLGEIEIVSRPRRREPVVQLLLRPSAITSSDLSLVNNSNTSDNDLVFSTGAFLLATPELGSDTRLVALAGGELIRYAGQDDGYNSLDFSLGIQQRLGRNTYAQLGWAQRQLFEQDGDREFVDNSAQLSVLHQERLGERLRLNGFYELRFSFINTNPSDQERIRNTLGARLGYDFTSQLEGAIDYRAVHESVTNGDFSGIRQQISAVTTYRPNRNLSISGTVSYLVGPSYTFEGKDDFLNNILFQLNIGLNLPLF